MCEAVRWRAGCARAGVCPAGSWAGTVALVSHLGIRRNTHVFTFEPLKSANTRISEASPAYSACRNITHTSGRRCAADAPARHARAGLVASL